MSNPTEGLEMESVPETLAEVTTVPLNAETPAEIIVEAIAPLSVGQCLRAAREKKGLTLTEVAEKIRFSPRQVEALEADDFSHLPERPFVRGFIRSYARLLLIDAVPLLETLPIESKKLAEVAEDLAEVKASRGIPRRIRLVFLAVVALILLTILLVWVIRALPISVNTPTSQETSKEIILPDVPAVASLVVAANSQVTPASAVLMSVSAVAASIPVAATPKPAASAVVLPIAAKTTTLRLVFAVESWTEVKDKNGVTIFKKIAQAGSEQTITGEAPFSLVIGNASGVRLYYQGEEVNLTEYTDISVAHLVLE